MTHKNPKAPAEMKTYFLRPRQPAVKLAPVSTAKHAADAGCPDGSWHRLTREQKARLSMLAREAFLFQKVQGMDRDEWRQEIAIRACGCRISEATQAHWADLKSAFQDLAGKPEKAFQTQMREGDNKRRVALYKLTGALAERGLQPAYAATICRAQFKCSLEEASAKQIWCLFYTVTNRRKTARQKTEDKKSSSSSSLESSVSKSSVL
jgi:hypothetical protein